MEPKYGFKNRKSINNKYSGPVYLDDHEWIYSQCQLPFYSEPIIHLHLHPQPLPQLSIQLNQKPNVVFIQLDALGRQAMYRRMPQSYQLLTSYRYVQSKR
jgi:hypothetical protein